MNLDQYEADAIHTNTQQVDAEEGQTEGEEEEEYFDLGGTKVRKIQIEGEESEFLMDDEGNIYNFNGEYVGTANAGAEEGNQNNEEKEEDKFISN